MKLPGINYQTAVGPDVSGLPLQEARAWSRAADNWANAIDGVSRELEVVEVEDNLLSADAEARDMVRKISRPVWNVSELGEPPSDISIKTRDANGPQAIYRTHEFAGQYYDKEIKRIGDKYSQGMSPRAKRRFNQKFMSYVAKQRNSVLESQYKGIQSHRMGVTAKALEMATQNVEWNDRYDVIDTANELINEQYRNGDIDLEDVVKEQARYRNIVMENAARRAISEAGEDINHLRDVEFLISQEPGLDDKARDRFATLAERKVNRIERKLQAEDKERREQNDADIRLRYFRGEVDAQFALNESRATGTPQGQRNLQDLVFVRGDTATRYSDPEVRANLEGLISDARMSADVDEATRVIDSLLVSIGSQPNPTLSPDDIRRFQDDVMELRSGAQIFKSEDYRSTDDSMYMDIVQQSKLSQRRPEKTKLARYRDAYDDLRDFLLKNPRVTANSWWKQNADFYTLESWWDRKIGLSGVPREYVYTKNDGSPNIAQTQKALNDALKDGEIGEEDYDSAMMSLKQLKREAKPE